MTDVMRFSDEQIRSILELKDQIIEEMEKHEEKIEFLRKNVSVLDSILKQTSFTKASILATSEDIKNQESALRHKKVESIPITKGNEGEVIANAYVTPDQVSIILDENIELNSDIPPFKSFFLDRIIGEMKQKDSAEVESGKIQSESVIDYVINKNGSNIREIIIKNYRQKDRINEIINTAGWSFSRMLENMNK